MQDIGKKAFRLIVFLLALAPALMLTEGCRDGRTSNDDADNQDGCDSTKNCGYPCSTSSTSYDNELTVYGTTTSQIQGATYAEAHGTSVTMSFRASGFKDDIEQVMDFSTTYYMYATDFDQDDAPPYANGNAPGNIHLICITDLIKVSPATTISVDHGDYVQGYSCTFKMAPRIVSGGELDENDILSPSPATIKDPGSVIKTSWNTGHDEGPLKILVYDGSEWSEPDPTEGGYNPVYELRLVGEVNNYWLALAIRTDTSSGLRFGMPEYYYDTPSSCSDENGTRFQVLNYYTFPSQSFTDDSLAIVFDIETVLGAQEQEFLFGDDHKRDSATCHYVTDTLFLTRWTNGTYNDPHNSGDRKIDSIGVSKCSGS